MANLNKLKELRTQRFLTQAELATKAKLSRRTIVRLETDTYTPNFRTIRALAKTLKVPPEDLQLIELTRFLKIY